MAKKKGADPVPATAAQEDRRMKPVRVDLKANDHERLERAADRIGLSIAAYVRMLILKNLAEEGSR